LIKAGFKGQIFATRATMKLAEIIMRDAAKIQKYRAMDAEKAGRTYEPQFTEQDVNVAMSLFKTIGFGKNFQPIPGVNARFLYAGHIAGAASIDLEVAGHGKITFSGDVGRDNSILMKKPEPASGAKSLVLESTYGDRKHVGNPKQDLARAIAEARQRGGKIIIPAFSLGRTQEILFLLNQLHHEGKLNVPVFLDSPMGARVTAVYRQDLGLFNDDVQAFARRHGDPFSFPGLTTTMRPWESESIAEHAGPAIIIAGSGMVEGGRVAEHIKRHIGDPNSTLMFISHQGKKTTGGHILETAQQGGHEVLIKDAPFALRAKVVKLGGFSGHADQDELSRFAGRAKSKTGPGIFLVHGEDQARSALSERLTLEGYTTHSPAHEQEVELDPAR
jgi:metallo-beta-lactamase family protein